MNKRERIVSWGLAGVFGLTTLAELLIILNLSTANNDLRVAGTAMSGQATMASTFMEGSLANCEATQTQQATLLAPLEGSATARASETPLINEATNTPSATPIPSETMQPTRTWTPAPVGCAVRPWARTPTRTPSPEVTVTLTPTGWVIESLTPTPYVSDTPSGPTVTPPGGGCEKDCGGTPGEKSGNPNNGDDRGDSTIPDGDTGTIPGQP